MILTKNNIKEIDLDGLINTKIRENNLDQLLLIVPTNRKARNLKRDLISSMPNRVASQINIETLETISTKLLSYSKSFRELSEAASTVFIKQSASEIKPKYFSIYKHDIPFGTLDKIKNVIAEYKRHGILPDDLRKESEKIEKSEKLKALDIADIYENYNKKCESLNAYELGDIYKNLILLEDAGFNKNFLQLYAAVKFVIVIGFDEFSKPEINIINRLADISGITLFINFDYNRSNKFIFAHIDKCFDKLEEKGFQVISDTTRLHGNNFRELIRDKLFTERLKKKNNYSGEIFKICAATREKEVELISREIKKMIIEEKIEPHNICLAFNLVQNYSAIVRDIFQKNGLPFNLSDRISLANSNSVITVINFLEIAENDFYFQNIFRAISSGFVEIGDIDYSNLYKVSSEQKIVSGKDNWLIILQDSIANLKLKSDEDEEELLFKERAYKKALSDIKLLVELLRSFEGKLTISEFKNKLPDFICKLKIPFQLLAVSEEKEKNIRSFTKFIETITEIFDLLEAEYGADAKFGLSFFMDQIRTACGWARFNVKEKSNYGVQITSINEIRGLNYDYLFIGGLCDGDLPTRYKPEIFFSGSFKKQAFIHQTEERNLFYQALCSWNKKLFLTLPLTENGKELVESSFLIDLQELIDISVINESDYEDSVFCSEEYLIHVGRNGFEKTDAANNGVNTDIEFLQKAIGVEKLREENILQESIYNGILFPKEINNKAHQFENIKEYLHSFLNKQYSISQLELYAKCPFKYFTERVLNINTIEEPSEDIEAIEMGRILHSILYEFYIKLREMNIDLKKCSDKEKEELLRMINEIAEAQLSNTAFRSPVTFYEKEKIFGIGGKPNESILSKFIEEESKDVSDYIPNYFEVSFGRLKKEGSDEHLSTQEPVAIDGINLRGKIDRLEISNDDSSFNIVDYKLSGKKPAPKELIDGISLQLPVYLYTAGELLKRKFGKDYIPNEMFIYSLKYAQDNFGKLPVSLKKSRSVEPKTNEELINISIEHIKNFIRQISEGKFNLSPHKDREKIVCNYCQYKSICRVEGSK